MKRSLPQQEQQQDSQQLSASSAAPPPTPRESQINQIRAQMDWFKQQRNGKAVFSLSAEEIASLYSLPKLGQGNTARIISHQKITVVDKKGGFFHPAIKIFKMYDKDNQEFIIDSTSLEGFYDVELNQLFRLLCEARRHLILGEHPNILLFCFLLVQDNSIPRGIMMPSMDGNLYDFIKSDIWSLDHMLGITTGLVMGLAYMHDTKLLHRDLKLSNVLIDGATLVPKYCDFGVAMYTGEDNTFVDPNVGKVVTTYVYASPSLLAQALSPNPKPIVYRPEDDIYSFMYILYECLTRTYTHKFATFKNFPKESTERMQMEFVLNDLTVEFEQDWDKLHELLTTIADQRLQRVINLIIYAWKFPGSMTNMTQVQQYLTAPAPVDHLTPQVQ